MTLDELYRVGLLKSKALDGQCKQRTLNALKRILLDAVNEFLCANTRFTIAHHVIRQTMLVALYFRGYEPNWDRPRVDRTLLVALPCCLGYSPQQIATLTLLWQAKIDAETQGNEIGEDVVELCIFEANELLKAFRGLVD